MSADRDAWKLTAPAAVVDLLAYLSTEAGMSSPEYRKAQAAVEALRERANVDAQRYCVTVGVMLLCDTAKGPRVLFGLRAGVDNGSGVWACPGGRMEWARDRGIVAAAGRELAEETGLTLDTDSAQVLTSAIKEGTNASTGCAFMVVFVVGRCREELRPSWPTDLHGCPFVAASEVGESGLTHQTWSWLDAAELATLPAGQVWDRDLALALVGPPPAPPVRPGRYVCDSEQPSSDLFADDRAARELEAGGNRRLESLHSL